MALRRLPILVLAASALAAPAAAQAGTAKVTSYQTCADAAACKYGVYETRQSVGFTAADGESNAVTISRSGAVVTVRDSGSAVTASDGCTSVSPNEAACSVNPTFAGVGVTLGDGNDSLTLPGSLVVPVTANGGAGNDQLNGGAENDTFDGGPGLDMVAGGGGADTFVSPPDDRALDTYDGGAGRDLLDYSARKSPLFVDLAAGAGEGEAGENDVVRGVEDVNGGSAADVLRGDAAGNRISGGPGADTLSGAGGADVLTGNAGTDNFDAGAGDDSLRVADAAAAGLERVTCGAGRDTVGQTELGGLYLDDLEYYGPQLDDVLDADCERALLPSELVTRMIFDPRLRRRSSATLAMANPCRKRGCNGRVAVLAPGVRKPVGRARFTRRGRLVPIGLSAAGRRALRRRKVLAVSLRVAASETAENVFSASYRTRVAR
jgi:hypothetical protein